MKVYIATDMEGVSGIAEGENGALSPKADQHRAWAELLMGDVNAAIDGVLAGGAAEVTVADCHAGGGNFIPEMLDPRAAQDPRRDAQGRRKVFGLLDETYAAVLRIGCHAMAGTAEAFLSHTGSSTRIYNKLVNSRRIGETTWWAIAAGQCGVPMVMVSGDGAACVEARQFLQPLETAVVKTARGRNHADCLPLDEARGRIREAARRSLALVGQAEPFTVDLPMEVVTQFTRTDYCEEFLATHPTAERLDPRTVRMVTDDLRTIV